MKIISQALISLCLFLMALSAFFAYLWPGIPAIMFLLGGCVLCLVLSVVLDFSFYKDFLLLKSTQKGLNMGALCSFVLIFLIALNILSWKTNRLFDFSEEKLSTLTPITQNILKQLQGTLDIKIFYRGNPRNVKRIDDVLRLYKQAKSEIKVEHINSLREPSRAAEYAEKSWNDVSSRLVMVFAEKEGRVVNIEPPFSEESFTQGFMRLFSSEKTKVYFISGHGERGFEKTQNGSDLVTLQKLLQNFSFKVETLSLLNKEDVKKIPQNSLLVIAGSSSHFLKNELKIIKNHFEKGGSLFLALEPRKNTNITSLLEAWGVRFDNNFLIDRSSGLEDGILATNSYDRVHEISKNFSKKNKITIYPTVGSFSALKKKKGQKNPYKVDVLVRSGPKSFSIKNFESQKIEVSLKSYPLAIMIHNSKNNKNKKGGLLLATGDVDFISSNYLESYFNKDLVLNIFHYLTGRDQLISVPREKPEIQNIIMTTVRQATLALNVALAPLVLFIIAFVLWIRRRKI